MKINQCLQIPVADQAVVTCRLVEPDWSDDPDFLDFIESISLSGEEMAAFISRPDLSISEIRRLVAAQGMAGAARLRL